MCRHHVGRWALCVLAWVCIALIGAVPTLASEPETRSSGETVRLPRPSLDDVNVDVLLEVMAPDPEPHGPVTADGTPAAAEPAREALGPWETLEEVQRIAAEGDIAGAWDVLRDQVARRVAPIGEPRRGAVGASPSALTHDLNRWSLLLLDDDNLFTVLKILGAFLVVFVVIRLVRGDGDVAVFVEYPPELIGSFDVRISKKNSKPRLRGAAGPRKSTRYEHIMVSRETKFEKLPRGTVYVTVEGALRAAEGEEVLESCFEEQPVVVRSGATERIVFDFQPSECTIDVKVAWDRRPVNDALIALRGVPGSVRFARGGPVRLHLNAGRHEVVVGSGDRIAEVAVETDSFHPITAEIDLGRRETLLFTGCPQAVEPYLQGDIATAARALEREGQTELSHRLLARLHEERSQHEIAASHYEKAGSLMEAARLYKHSGNFARAAELFDRAGEAAEAAGMYRSAGQLVEAGQAFETISEFDSAVACYREADDVDRWVDALDRQGERYQAGKLAHERGNSTRAIRSLQQVPYADDDYLDAATLLIDIFRTEGHSELAADKVDEVIRQRGDDAISLETCSRVSDDLERGGEYARAYEMLEIVRRRDATYPGLDSRMEALRKRRSEAANQTLDGVVTAPTTPVGVTQSPFESTSRYELLSEVGRGGMGVVYKARDLRLGRMIALKRLPENLRNHPTAVKLFLREARSAAALNHPNIVTLFDAGQEEGQYYLTMELLEGSGLHQILRVRGRLSARNTAKLGIQIAAGLHYAHDQRIVHRDIKTANLFFTRTRQVKIMDFGLAKMVEEVRKSTTMVGGTPYYMPPEQSLGEAIDHRADLYALGVTFFELVTGKVPFTDGDVAMHHRHTPPPDPRQQTPDLPGDFAELILQLMEKSPEARPATAAEVSERLQVIARALS